MVIGHRRESYTAETLSIAVGVGCILAVLLGFLAGWGCAKRCRKDHDNIPYPDMDYEYVSARYLTFLKLIFLKISKSYTLDNITILVLEHLQNLLSLRLLY